MTSTTFAELDLRPSLLKAIARCGYESPTEVQTRAVPVVLRGSDLLATAQTGGGKTASFVLPLLHLLAESGSERSSRKRQHGPGTRRNTAAATARPRALIVAPTRELAIQIAESVGTYGKGTGISSAVVYGGAPKPQQERQLSQSPDILIATPGRLLDFVNERRINLSAVGFLVLDEADRMFDMGFLPDVRRIVAMTAAERQTLLFSATMPNEVEQLAASILRDPQRIECEGGSLSVESIEHSVMFVEQSDKQRLLVELISERQMFRALVFTRTKHKASRLARHLSKHNIDSDAIHGDRTQNQRGRALNAFRNGKLQVLVATDVAARGIDVDDITHVINFEMPNEAETYVHRIGRTGRAGADGEALSLCNRDEVVHLRSIERLLERSIRIDREHAWHIDVRTGGGRAGNNGQRPAERGRSVERGRKGGGEFAGRDRRRPGQRNRNRGGRR